MVLIFAQHMRMNIEVCDVPSAYLNTPLPKGKKHLMRIKPLLAKYFIRADISAKEFLQAVLVQLESALYGLSEAAYIIGFIANNLNAGMVIDCVQRRTTVSLRGCGSRNA